MGSMGTHNALTQAEGKEGEKDWYLCGLVNFPLGNSDINFKWLLKIVKHDTSQSHDFGDVQLGHVTGPVPESLQHRELLVQEKDEAGRCGIGWVLIMFV